MQKHKKTKSLNFENTESESNSAVSPTGNFNGVPPRIEYSFYEAIHQNNVSKVMEYLNKENLDINWQNPEDNLKTGLHLAIEMGDSILVALLLGKGSKVHLRDNKGRAALNVAVQTGNKEVLSLLANRTILSLEQALNGQDYHFLSEEILPQNGLYSSTPTNFIHHRNSSTESHTPAPTPSLDRNYLQNLGRSLSINRPQGTELFRVHVARQSLISEMLQISHFQTIYNIFVAVFLIAFANTLLSNYMEKGVFIEFDLLIWCFGQAPNAVLVWLTIFCISFSAYFLQEAILKKILSPHLAYTIHAIIITTEYVLLPWYVVGVRKYPPATAFAISAEMVRLTMKMHSYLMVNLQLRHAKDKKSQDESVKEYPGNVNIYNYWLFLWFPTLVYQPSYPRTDSIRFSFVIRSFGDSMLCILFTYAIFVRYCVPHFKEFYGDLTHLVMGVFHVMLPGIAINLLGFFGILHSWFNAFAELTRFADRHFYSDWWNATGWGTYYRKWNFVVHNFLHRHIFMDAMQNYGKGKHFSLWLTFIISAVVHEYIVAIGLGFYKPILFVLFIVPGVLFIYLTKFLKGNRFWNIFMWAMLIVGHGILVGLYSRAWHIHYYSSPKERTIIDYIWII